MKREETSGELVHHLLERSADTVPDKIALIFGATSYTYRDINYAADEVARYLRSTTQHQESVGLLIGNEPDFIISYFGILKSGRAAVPLDIGLPDEVLASRLDHSETNLVITTTISLKRFQASSLSDFSPVTLSDIASSAGTPSSDELSHTSDMVASLLYTTGTTGASKGVMMSHRAIVAATHFIIKRLNINSSDIDVNALPLTHSFGLGHVHCLFAVGGTVVLRRNFIDLRALVDDLAHHRATTFSAPPLVFDLLALHFAQHIRQSATCVRYAVTNSAPIKPETSRVIVEALPNANFYTYYGLTEASRSTFHNLSKNPNTLTSVGEPSPGVEVRILDDQNVSVSEGTVGEIVIRSPALASGYFKNSQATQSAFRDGWFWSGDLGIIRDGLLYVVGRKDDLINVGGKKVYPEEVERVVREAPGISESVVFSIPDDHLGEAVAVAVVVSGGEAFDQERFLDFCRSRLESFQVPRQVMRVTDIPKSTSGKIKRHALREIFKTHEKRY